MFITRKKIIGRIKNLLLMLDEDVFRKIQNERSNGILARILFNKQFTLREIQDLIQDITKLAPKETELLEYLTQLEQKIT